LKNDTKYGTILQRERRGSVPSTEKIIDKMKRQPNGIRPEEVEKVLMAYGYEPVRQKGSHRQYLNRETGELITIKQENPLKKVYIVDVLNRIGE
jgi:predicted RNA binding protein YcfA (HicA-like mRNA interferase family)